jgi:two-component system, chemotaxis family, sensor kinase Cph1
LNSIRYRNDEPPRIEIRAVPEEREWRFSVKDNGMGIDPQYAEKIFGIFKYLHSRDKYPGSGMGLAICRQIVTRHEGKIWVESSLGKGATFFFTLPRWD